MSHRRKLRKQKQFQPQHRQQKYRRIQEIWEDYHLRLWYIRFPFDNKCTCTCKSWIASSTMVTVSSSPKRIYSSLSNFDRADRIHHIADTHNFWHHVWTRDGNLFPEAAINQTTHHLAPADLISKSLTYELCCLVDYNESNLWPLVVLLYR